MSCLCVGVDEAGYGPLLGPLVVGRVTAEAASATDLTEAWQHAATGVKDSKQLHRSGDLAPLETVALAIADWTWGTIPATAGEWLARLEDVRTDQPWEQGADRLTLPVRTSFVPTWTVDGVTPNELTATVIAPTAINRARAEGVNKADLEWQTIGRGLHDLAGRADRIEVVVDRLGGRRYYGNLLTALDPAWSLDHQEEAPTCSTYHLITRRGTLSVCFAVGGEARSPLTAMASIIAKYTRELLMLLFNRWWCDRYRDLTPTAGYPTDAHRWLACLDKEDHENYGPHLVRGYGRTIF